MVAVWTVQLLGQFAARRGDVVVTRFRTHKADALFAYLAYHNGTAFPREVLMTMLWPDSHPHDARNSLSVSLSSLRRRLEPPAWWRGP